MIVYAVVDDALSPEFPLGNALEEFIRREDAERFLEKVRSDDPGLASKLWIEERDFDLRSAHSAQCRVPSRTRRRRTSQPANPPFEGARSDLRSNLIQGEGSEVFDCSWRAWWNREIRTGAKDVVRTSVKRDVRAFRE